MADMQETIRLQTICVGHIKHNLVHTCQPFLKLPILGVLLILTILS